MASSGSVRVIASNSNLNHNHNQQQQHHMDMDRLDAARALLGVSPASDSATTTSNNRSRLGLSTTAARVTFAGGIPTAVTAQPITARTFQTQNPAQQDNNNNNSKAARVTFEKPLQPAPIFQLAPPAVISNGLDALAALASSEQASWEKHAIALSRQDDIDIDMPPPPPRGGRRRSVSNPEGMEKWAPPGTGRRHFVLPASILEEELAEASAAMEAHKEVQRKNSMDAAASSIAEEEEEEDVEEEEQSETSSTNDNTTANNNNTTQQQQPISGLMSEEEQANLTPEELLKRARSRLLEDLSEGNLTGEKGVLTLPHSLSKYKEVYNKNGRIGIYTPAERAAIIARFNHKRSRRVWNKKIRYNCRKNLADRRMRVKGRFVKRSTEQQARGSPPTGSTAPPKGEGTNDQDMPDVTDPEAGFCPTEDLPYRRTRRHTIT